MVYRLLKNTFLFVLIITVSCGRSSGQVNSEKQEQKLQVQKIEDSKVVKETIILGANRTKTYLPMLQDKKIGIIGNQSSLVQKNKDNGESIAYTHLVDSLLALDINILKVFAPEHGFRGTADAGESIKDGKDSKTGLPIISLYGDNKKPKQEQLKGIELMVFDLQDVGARFYTYISTLHYAMEACAEAGIPLIILDRPNPNGSYVDGPLLEAGNESFVGMHPVPIVHGLTIGEYAQMINGENWLKNGLQCELLVIKMENYTHDKHYDLPVKPSPNLPNSRAINLYPSLCLFEGTNVNAGRGTNKQFQVYGSPFLDKEVFTYSYTPISKEGAKSPKHMSKLCYGEDLSEKPALQQINLSWLVNAYKNTSDKTAFFNSFFTKLAGGTTLQKQIEAGMSSEEIRKSWQPNLEEFKLRRKAYLLYK